jgi:predicted MFS family arabinose efflux permease
MSTDAQHKIRTLWLAGALHAFTHVYQVALMPLYLLIQRDFKLVSVSQATLLVTVMMAGYFLPAYPLGIAADRFSRKKLLGWGLAINAAGFLLLALAPNYPTALLAVLLTGLGGSAFHPSATAVGIKRVRLRWLRRSTRSGPARKCVCTTSPTTTPGAETTTW